MRGFKIICGVALLLASIAVTAACYIQSHGAGIGTGALLFIVITAYVYDHGRDILGKAETSAVANRSNATKVAMNQGRLTAMQHDGELSVR